MKNDSNKLAKELYEGWSMVDVAFRLRILPKLQSLGVSSAQFEVLFALDHFGKKDVSVKDLAELSLKSSSATTQLIAGLEKQNLVERKHSSSDRRVVYVTLTGAGAAKFKEMHQMITDIVSDTISNLSESEAKEYIRINNKIAENI